MCHRFRVSKKFMVARAVSRISVEVFCLAVSKNVVGEISVFHKNSVIENFHEKGGGGGGREYQDFPSNFFCLSA